jgi:hypothetical protein
MKDFPACLWSPPPNLRSLSVGFIVMMVMYVKCLKVPFDEDNELS